MKAAVRPPLQLPVTCSAARKALCDDAFGDLTTYCRNMLAVTAMTSALYLRP